MSSRKPGIIYANKDEKGNVLTYSILYRLTNGTIVELERNTRGELDCFRAPA